MVSKAAQAAAARRSAVVAEQKAALRRSVPASELERVAGIAARKIADVEADSRLFSKDMLDVIPRFSADELSTGRVLGKGGFGTVREVRSFRYQRAADENPAGSSSSSNDGDEEDDLKDQKHQDRKFIADHCLRESGDARYCIKALSPEIVADKALFAQGVIDMAVETMFLSVVSHPHIITMRAFGSGDMTGPDHFIVLDRLYDTLEARIPKWRVQSKKARSFVNKMRGSSVGKLGGLLETKLRYAYDLMGAFEYLHKNRIVYRDLKPENVGFNIRDDIVLFDFGISREIHDEDRLTDKTWKLSGETGSLRYMAPEVATNEPYGFSADMYSFGIMLWEMLRAEKPFAGYSRKILLDLVVRRGGRPRMDDAWGPSLKGFLSLCWHRDLRRRPGAASASAILKREASKAAAAAGGGGGAAVDLNNFRRKSTFVNRNALRERKSLAAPQRRVPAPIGTEDAAGSKDLDGPPVPIPAAEMDGSLGGRPSAA